MKKAKTREDPQWLAELEESGIEVYDASGTLEAVNEFNLPYIDRAKYVDIDNIEEIQDKAVGTTGIFRCAGIVISGENSYLGHATPGEIGKTTEELLEEVEGEVDSVSYALGGAPNLELLRELTEKFTQPQKAIYTGRDGSIALDTEGTLYRMKNGEKSYFLTGNRH